MKNIRQKWQWERCFHSKGTIAGITVRLRQVANYASTLPEESEELKVMAAKLGNMVQIWSDERVRKRSWDKYKHLKKEITKCP